MRVTLMSVVVVAAVALMAPSRGAADGFTEAEAACRDRLGTGDHSGHLCLDISGDSMSTVQDFHPTDSIVGSGSGLRVCVVRRRDQHHVRVSVDGERQAISGSVLAAGGKLNGALAGALATATESEAAPPPADGSPPEEDESEAPTPAVVISAIGDVESIPELDGVAETLSSLAEHTPAAFVSAGWQASAIDRVQQAVGERRQTLEDGPLVIDCLDFVPRADGGTADVTVRYDDASDHTIALPVQELIVSRAYVGAARIGVGVTLDAFRGYDAVPERWGLVSTQFADERQVRSLGDPSAAVEVIIGGSAFWFDLLVDRRGRDYRRRDCSSLTWRCATNFVPAIYVGLGLLSATLDSISALSSVHVGLEWELVQGFAVAVTAAFRRGQHLQSWVTEGTTIPGDAVPLEGDDWRPSFGLVLNISPDFLQIPGAGS